MLDNMNQTDFTRILDEKVDAFLQQVNHISEIGPFTSVRKVNSDFPIFKPANPEYYEYRYFEECLIWYIRDYLVNGVFMELFNLHGIKCSWPSSDATYVRFSNEAIEDCIPFEFIVYRDGKKIGYRYTSVYDQDVKLKNLFRQYHLDRIEIIDWEKDDITETANRTDNQSSKYSTKIKRITLGGFFSQHFSDKEFHVYIATIRTAVQKANTAIGFQTIPQLSLRYLMRFKTVISNNLSQMRFQDMQYQSIDGEYQANPNNRIPTGDYGILESHFISDGLYRALVGNDDFAKCFITSEYLYYIFKGGNSIDYTSVVSGYFKSIEQLACKMMKISLSLYGDRGLYIKANRKYKGGEFDNNNKRVTKPNEKTRSRMISFEKKYERFFDITMAPLIWFMHDNEGGWHISKDGKEAVTNYLNDFNDKYRNNHFHKHNIYEFEVVKRTRNNAIYLAYLLLGGYKLYEGIEETQRALGIVDDSFDRIYKKITELPRGVNRYVLEFEVSHEVMVMRKYDQESPIYDANGSLHSSIIRFVKVNDFNTVDYDKLQDKTSDENEVIISHDNIPLRMWYELSDGKRVPIEW